jgi:hypothetical protein
MSFLAKNKSDVILGLLFIESVLLSLVLENKGLFWAIFVVSTITVFLYSIMVLDIHVKKFLESDKRDDVIFIIIMTALMNANITVFPNRIILGVIFIAYYIGLRYLIWMFERRTVSQTQKNALNLSVLLIVFLGANFNANIAMIAEKSIGGFVVLPATLLIFIPTYLVTYYNFTKNRVSKKWTRVYSLVMAFILSETAILAGFYLERYPSIYKVESVSNMSIVTLPLFLVVIYYMLHGLMIHKLEKRLAPRLLMEYIGISAVIMATLFVTIKWFAE